MEHVASSAVCSLFLAKQQVTAQVSGYVMVMSKARTSAVICARRPSVSDGYEEKDDLGC